MKIKALILLLSFAFTTASFSNSFMKDDKTDMGDGGIMLMSRQLLIPAVATTIEPKSSIEVTFTDNIGVVYGSVKNYAGITVIQTKADTSNEVSMSINIANLVAGTYIFTISTAYGNIVKSEKFTVD